MSHHFSDATDFSIQASKDLATGMAVHNLQAVIDDINDARRQQAKPGEFSQWMHTFTKTAKDLGHTDPRTGDNRTLSSKQMMTLLGLPATTSIVGVDESGKNLVVADSNAHKGLVLSPIGGVVKTLSEDEVAARVPQHMVKASDVLKGDGKFSIVMPPGLDTTGNGAFKVRDWKDEKRTNSDGTVTHYVSGKLSDSGWGMNVHGYEGKSASAFKGNYTTTRDGMLLNSHIAYDAKERDVTLLGGYVKEFPNIAPNPTIPFRELGKSVYGPNIDTVYSKTTGDYLTLVDLQPNADMSGYTKSYETLYSNGSAQWQEISHPGAEMNQFTGSRRYREYDAARDKSNLKRDAAGNVIEVTYDRNRDYSGGLNKAIIVRDTSENPVEITEDDGTQWNKIAAGRWKKTTTDGQSTTFLGQVMVEDSGNIIFADKTQVIIDPARDPYVRRQYVNNQGQVTAEDLGKVHNQFQYGANGRLIATTSGINTPTEKSSYIDTNPVTTPTATELKFFEFHNDL